jgi:hypothetical protein
MTTDLSDTDDLIVLTRVAAELASLIDDEPPKYRFTANRIANAAVPAELIHYIRGHYYVRRSNLRAFAQALGLRLRQPGLPEPGRPRASRRSAA